MLTNILINIFPVLGLLAFAQPFLTYNHDIKLRQSGFLTQAMADGNQEKESCSLTL